MEKWNKTIDLAFSDTNVYINEYKKTLVNGSRRQQKEEHLEFLQLSPPTQKIL